MLCWCSADALLTPDWCSVWGVAVSIHMTLPQWLPILQLWVNVVAQPLDYPRCNTLNCWRSVNAHFDTGALTIAWPLLLIIAANMLILGIYGSRAIGLYKMQHPKLLTLCWLSVDAVLMLCWCSVDALLMLCWLSVDAHFEELQHRHIWYCQYRLPKLRLWVNITAQPLEYTRCNTLNRWRSVDAHFLTGDMIMSPSLLLITAANSLILGICCNSTLGLYKMQHPKSMTLCWRLLSELGCDQVAFSFAHKGC
jgi:hypothetical protein